MEVMEMVGGVWVGRRMGVLAEFGFFFLLLSHHWG
jgi:hypothetical protein